jgi:hypothetical protein
MILTRFYYKSTIEARKLRGVRGLLANSFNWGISNAAYELFYPSERFTIVGTDELEKVVNDRGEPHSFSARFRTQAGSLLVIDTTRPNQIVIEASPTKDSPSKTLDAVGAVLGLKLVDSVPTEAALDTAFIIHGFNEDGRNCASELARFLELLGINAHSGRTFAPRSVSDKVEEGLTRYNLIFAILTPQEDTTWINQEMAAAKIIGKPLFVLKQEDTEFKPALLGDIEYISFSRDNICRTFIPILEGMKELRGIGK